MSEGIEIVKQKVKRYCAELFPQATENEDGQIWIQYESTVVMVEVAPVEYTPRASGYRGPHQLPACVVKIMAVLLMKAPQNPALHQWIATSAHKFPLGATQLYPQSDGSGVVVYNYALAGDTLDPQELKFAVLTVALAADELDDELKTRFGGIRHADMQSEEI